jgi:hypothetical protein
MEPFPEHLVLELEYKPIVAELVQPKFVLQRHRQEGETARSSSTHCTFTRSHCTEAIPSFGYTLNVRYCSRLRGFVRRRPHPRIVISNTCPLVRPAFVYGAVGVTI